MSTVDTSLASDPRAAGGRRPDGAAFAEPHRLGAFPISRWYVCPAAGWLAQRLVASSARPVHLTACGLLCGTAAAVMVALRPNMAPLAAVLVLLAWFFDRTDGKLARLQGTASSLGAWLDANVDELLDIGWHAAIAFAAASQDGSPWPWIFLISFLGGKYLFMHGLMTDPSAARGQGDAVQVVSSRVGWLRKVYHLPGSADARVHLLIAALCTGWFTPELALISVYYNFRWIVRYGIVARRLGGAR